MKRIIPGSLCRTLLLALSLALALCGCQMNLYSGVDEKEATSMMAMLMEQGIACDKVPAKKGWDLLVDKSDLPMAVRILARDGYPKSEYKTTGDLFGAKGLISSPQEDRIRYIYGISQEIAKSISQMDGALSADVHLVMPENDPLSDSLKPSSASVFIKYHPNSSLRQNITQIKQLVLNAVQGLTMEKVSVITVAGTETDVASVPKLDIAGIHLFRDSLWPFLGLVGGTAIACLGIGYGVSFMLFKRVTKSMKIKGKGVTGNLASL